METFPRWCLTAKSIVTAYYKCSSFERAAPESFVMHSYRRFCVFSRIFKFVSSRQVSNIFKLVVRTNASFPYGAISTTDTKAPFCNFMKRFGRKKRVWSGRRRLQYLAELSVCWSSKCQTIHIHLFGRPQQRGKVQTEMADISAFKRLTAAHKQHANTHTLSERPARPHTHTHTLIFTHLACCIEFSSRILKLDAKRVSHCQK